MQYDEIPAKSLSLGIGKKKFWIGAQPGACQKRKLLSNNFKSNTFEEKQDSKPFFLSFMLTFVKQKTWTFVPGLVITTMFQN